jgi:hypothetical protein
MTGCTRVVGESGVEDDSSSRQRSSLPSYCSVLLWLWQNCQSLQPFQTQSQTTF